MTFHCRIVYKPRHLHVGCSLTFVILIFVNIQIGGSCFLQTVQSIMICVENLWHHSGGHRARTAVVLKFVDD